MSKDATLVYEFSSDWNILKELREKLLVQLQGEFDHLSDPIIMAASELVENAIKYGDTNFRFCLNIDQGCITIQVTSAAPTGERYNILKENIDKIRNCKDPFDLYANRLRELMDAPQNGPTRIGLFRLAYEGKFELDCKKENNQIQITAKRNIE